MAVKDTVTTVTVWHTALIQNTAPAVQDEWAQLGCHDFHAARGEEVSLAYGSILLASVVFLISDLAPGGSSWW